MQTSMLIATRLARVSAVAGLVIGVASASAAPAASVSFTSFAYTTSGGTLTWSTLDAYQSLFVQASEAGGIGGNDERQLEVGNWLAGGISAGTTSASASATVGAAQTFAVAAGATPNFASAFAFPHSAMASGSMGGAFSLSAPGTVTFTIGYAIDASAPGGNAVNDFAVALAQLYVGNYATGSSDSTQLELQSFDNANGISQAAGTFTLTVSLAAAGDVGYYNLLANSAVTAPASVVPEPSQVALLLAGLGGMGMWMRRRRHQALA